MGHVVGSDILYCIGPLFNGDNGNGAELKLDFEVTAIDKEDCFFHIHSPAGVVEAKYVVNAAGLYARQGRGDPGFR